MHHLVALSAKYSMLDIFVVAIMIVAFKIGHMANVSGLAGIYIFTGAIALSIAAEKTVDISSLKGEGRDE